MIIRNARVLTLDSANRVLDSGAVEILPDGLIGQVGDTSAGRRAVNSAARQYPSSRLTHNDDVRQSRRGPLQLTAHLSRP